MIIIGRKTKKLALAAVLTCIASVLFVVEMQIPPFIPVPGVKLGLSNTVTLFVLCLGENWTRKDAVLILTARILLVSLLTGQPSALMFSLPGGLSALLAMIILRAVPKNLPIPFLSVAGAVFHNTAQILSAAVFMGTLSVFAYIPALAVSGIASGLLTGFAVYFLFKSYPRFINYFKNI